MKTNKSDNFETKKTKNSKNHKRVKTREKSQQTFRKSQVAQPKKGNFPKIFCKYLAPHSPLDPPHVPIGKNVARHPARGPGTVFPIVACGLRDL